MTLGVPWKAWTEAEVEKVRELVAAGLGAREVAEIVGRPRKGVISIVTARNLGTWAARGRIPDDFAERWQTASLSELALHYSISVSTAGSYAQRLNLKRPTGVRIGKKPGPPKTAVKPVRKPVLPESGRAYSPAIISEAVRDMSIEGQAQRYLQKWTMVYRKDGAWVYGSRRMTGPELIERAVSKGMSL